MQGTISDSRKVIKLNIGCGSTKIEDYINIDSNAEILPELVLDFRKESLPFEANSVDEVVMFHVIEHIEEKYHEFILGEVWKVLKPGGLFLISYPEFIKCAANYIDNHRGMREFWKKTIYGLQRYPGDYHVSLMDTDFFVELLDQMGFEEIEYQHEKGEDYNTIVKSVKGEPQLTYEELIGREIFPEQMRMK